MNLNQIQANQTTPWLILSQDQQQLTGNRAGFRILSEQIAHLQRGYGGPIHLPQEISEEFVSTLQILASPDCEDESFLKSLISPFIIGCFLICAGVGAFTILRAIF